MRSSGVCLLPPCTEYWLGRVTQTSEVFSWYKILLFDRELLRGMLTSGVVPYPNVRKGLRLFQERVYSRSQKVGTSFSSCL